IDIFRARQVGIDAFGVDLLQLNFGRYWDAAQLLCKTASEVAPDFKIVAEPDMAALEYNVTEASLEEALSAIAKCVASYHMPVGRLLVVPFHGSAKSPEFWLNVEVSMRRQGGVAFIPILLDPARTFRTYARAAYGLANWGAADPNDADKDLAAFSIALPTVRGVWMPAVKPQDARPKSSFFWEAGNTE